MRVRLVILWIGIAFLLAIAIGCDEDNLPQEFVDDIPPQVQIVSPANNANVTGVVEVMAVATDEHSDIAQLELYIDNNRVQAVAADTVTFSWNTSELEDGSQHAIMATATDSEGNTGQSTALNVFVNIVDTDPPTIVLTAPTQDAQVNGVVAITAEAQDNIAVSTVTFYIDGSPEFTDNQSPWQYDWDTTGLPENSFHDIYATAADGAGNETTSATVGVEVAGNIDFSRVVLAEMFTGTWCVPCNEFADPATDSLVNLYGPEQLVSVQYHGGGPDPWLIPGTITRQNYYSVAVYPTSLFDGGFRIAGANEGTFDEYRNAIDGALEEAPMVGFTHLSGSLADGTVTVQLRALADLSGMNLKLRGTINENDLTYSGHVYNHVVRHHFDDQLVNITAEGDTEDHTVTFSLDGEWQSDNLELILFVQDDASQLVLQAFILTE